MVATQPAAVPVASAKTTPRVMRPALPVLIALAGGIAAGNVLPIAPATYAWLALAAGVFALATVKRRRLATLALLLAFSLTGIGLLQVSHDRVAPSHLVLRIGPESHLARLRLRILTPATTRLTEHPFRQTTTAARAEALAIESEGHWLTCSGSLLLRISGESPALRPGQVIESLGTLSAIQGPENPGEYDWQAHFAQEGIRLRCGIGDGRAVRVVADEGEGWLWTCRRWVRQAFAAGFSTSQQLDRAALQTLLLGDNDDLLEQTWADFRATGTAHHLSISGMHVGIVAVIILLCTRSLLVSPRSALLVTLTCVLAYAAMTQPSPPVVRSVLLCLTLAAARLAGRNTDPLQALAVGVIAMLLYNPLDLANPGFQLSVAAVAGLLLWARPVQQWMESWEHEHDRMARQIRPPRGIWAVYHRLRAMAIEALAAGIVAHLITLPLVAWHFGQMNPYAIVCGIALAPFVGLALVAALSKTLLTLLIPPAASWLAAAAVLPSLVMRDVVGWMAHWPGSQFSAPPIPLWVLGLYGVLACLPVLPLIRQWRRAWIGPALAMLAGMLLPLWASLFVGPERGSLRLTVLSVGNGSAMLVQLPDGQSAMVDCGSMFNPRLFDGTIQPALRTLGVSKLDAVLLTHEDRDHVSALPDIVKAYHPSVFHHLASGEQPIRSRDCQVEVLAPDPATRLAGNDASAVLRIRYAGRSLLFTGDIQDKGISALLAQTGSLETDVLLAPHHGSAVAATARLLEAARPHWVLCSSAHSRSGRQAVFDRLCATRGKPTLRTGDAGAITVTINAKGAMDVRTWR